MNLTELVTHTRSFRRFDERIKVDDESLRHLADLGRLAASARNKQSIQFALINSSELCHQIFPLLSWAGYLSDWDGPSEGERPTAYIVVLNNNAIYQNKWCDDGLATQNIRLGITELGLGSCIIGAVNREKLREILHLPTEMEIRHVIAIGKPAEKVVLEEMKDEECAYWRDENSTLHVPKRSLKNIYIEYKDKT